MTKGVLDQGELSNPVRLSRQPATVPSGPAPVHVIGVQKRLQELRYLPADGASGTWDDRTRHAVIAFQGWQGLARDGIVGPQTIAALEASGPPRPSTGGSASRIEVHRAKGVVLLIEGSQVIRAVHSSAGAPGYETPTGSYSVFRKERNSWSVPYQVWLPYASYFNAGIALHGYADVPAHPASHGCVRVPTSEAPSVYEFAAVGTQVTVF
jgi:peptidoglycan hydrolase-like protein with peptidoglycan-binding domain